MILPLIMAPVEESFVEKEGLMQYGGLHALEMVIYIPLFTASFYLL